MGLCASTPVVENEKSRKDSQGSFKRATTLDAHNVTETAVKNILRHRHRQVVHDGHKTDMEFKRGSHLDIPVHEKSSEKRRFLSKALDSHFFIYKEMSEEMQNLMVDALEEDTTIQERDFLMKRGAEGD